MNQYRRIVSYLYQYLNGEKGQNIGYVRLEQKGRQCRVTVQMRAVETSFMPEVWLFKQERRAIEYISIGRLAAHSGSMQLKIVTNAEDVCSSGHPASDFDGAVVYISDRQYYATTWANESIYIGNKINMLDKEAYNSNRDDASTGSKDHESRDTGITGNTPESETAGNTGTDNETLQDKPLEDVVNKEEEDTKDGGDSNSAEDGADDIEENSTPEDINYADVKTQDIEDDKTSYGCSACPYKNYDKKEEDFGVRILKNFPVMYPFRSGSIEESVRIEPKDIGCMPIRLWSFANNRFLLHGYYCYKHLIFAKLCNGCYALGVPGVYSEQESKRAAAFSFNDFQPVGPGKVVYGVFGYWITEISV